jgi:hypothetical protein
MFVRTKNQWMMVRNSWIMHLLLWERTTDHRDQSTEA